MKLRLKQDLTAYNFVKEQEQNLEQGTEFVTEQELIPNQNIRVANETGVFEINSIYIETQAEEDDGI